MTRAIELGCLVLVAACASCAGGKGANGAPDRFVDAKTSDAGWARTSDERLRIPLPDGLTWERRPDTGSLLDLRAKEGPTFIVVAEIADAPTPIETASCAERHRTEVYAAASSKGIAMTLPQISFEVRRGEKMPRMSYAVPLEPAADARPASTLSLWTYVVDGARCVGVGVTTVVRGRVDKPDEPEQEDLDRLERVYDRVADGVGASGS